MVTSSRVDAVLRQNLSVRYDDHNRPKHLIPHHNIYSHQCRSLLVVHQDLALLVHPLVPKNKLKNK